MRIGDVAAAAEIPPETVRYYEKRGLLTPPARAANGYRTYDDAALKPVIKMDWVPTDDLIPVPVDPNWTGPAR